MAIIRSGLQDTAHGLYEIVLAGSFTGNDRSSFTALLAEAQYHHAQHVALSCAAVTFLHTDALDLLFLVRKTLADKGCQLYLVAPSPAVKLKLNRTLSDYAFPQPASLAALLQELA